MHRVSLEPGTYAYRRVLLDVLELHVRWPRGFAEELSLKHPRDVVVLSMLGLTVHLGAVYTKYHRF